MMSGSGPFGPIGMGGMLTVVKVRDDVQPGDYRDPGWYQHPPGTVAYEFTGTLPETPRAPQPAADAGTLSLRKPAARGPGGHAH